MEVGSNNFPFVHPMLQSNKIAFVYSKNVNVKIRYSIFLNTLKLISHKILIDENGKVTVEIKS